MRMCPVVVSVFVEQKRTCQGHTSQHSGVYMFRSPASGLFLSCPASPEPYPPSARYCTVGSRVSGPECYPTHPFHYPSLLMPSFQRLYCPFGSAGSSALCFPALHPCCGPVSSVPFPTPSAPPSGAVLCRRLRAFWGRLRAQGGRLRARGSLLRAVGGEGFIPWCFPSPASRCGKPGPPCGRVRLSRLRRAPNARYASCSRERVLASVGRGGFGTTCVPSRPGPTEQRAAIGKNFSNYSLVRCSYLPKAPAPRHPATHHLARFSS